MPARDASSSTRAAGVVGLLALCGLLALLARAAHGQTPTPSPSAPPPPPPPDSCLRLTDCPADVALPTAAACETAGDCACAQQIDCYVRNADPAASWPLVPTGALHWNAFFWHPRFLQTRISPGAEAAFRAALDPANPMRPMPAGSILYKQGFPPVDGHPGVPQLDAYDIYVATKLDGRYCPEGAAVGTSCQGGDWFWYHTDSATPQDDHSRLQGGDMFSGYGKPSKCVPCHDTAQRADFLITIMIQRRYPPAGPAGE